MDLSELAWDGAGLVTVVAQDRHTGQVRMVAHASEEALARTLSEGVAWFYSRSRAALWKKGERSGNALAVFEVWADCDGDAIVYLVDPEGPSCHTGRRSCFFRRLAPKAVGPVAGAGVAGGGAPGTEAASDAASVGSTAATSPAAATGVDAAAGPAASVVPVAAGGFEEAAPTLQRVSDVLEARRAATGARSYTRSLLDGGAGLIGGKVREEADELARALSSESDARVVAEAADVLYHVAVGLVSRGLSLRDLQATLAERLGVSGHDEKASRTTER